jgi:hypothetical protein
LNHDAQFSGVQAGLCPSPPLSSQSITISLGQDSQQDTRNTDVEDGNRQAQATTQAAPPASGITHNETMQVEHAIQDASTGDRERRERENMNETNSKNNSEANGFMGTRPAFRHRSPWINDQSQTHTVFNQNGTKY